MANTRNLRDAVFGGIFAAIGALGYNIPSFVFLLSVGIVTVSSLLIHGIRSRFRSLSQVFSTLWGLCVLIIPAMVVLGWFQYQMHQLGYPWNSFLAWEVAWYNHIPKEIYPYTLSVFLFSFGVLPLFFLPIIIGWIKHRTRNELFLFCMVGIPICLYMLASKRLIPIPKIRFAFVAPYVFGTVFAVRGIALIDRILRPQRFLRTAVMICIYSLVLLNAVSGIVFYWIPLTKSVSYDSIVHLSASHSDMITAVNAIIPPYSRVMVPYGIGTILPAFTKQHVFVGHMVNTSDVWNKYANSQQFYSGAMTPKDARDLLRSFDITHVIWEYGQAPESYQSFLTPISQSGMWIYQVVVP